MKSSTQGSQLSNETIRQLTARLAIAEIAIQLMREEAQLIVDRARYHDRIHQYEGIYGRLNERLSPSNPRHAGVIAFSQHEYVQYAGRKREVYNAKRRLQAAVRRFTEGRA